MRENIQKQFGAIAREYDQQRRKLIPCFDDFYGFQLLAAKDAPKHQSILDIGAGTGLLTSLVCQVYPEAVYTLIDLSPEMIGVAKQRFEKLSHFTYVVDDYTTHEFEGKFDLIISSLSIHHLEDEEKKVFFKKVYSLLNDQGVFVNGDQFISRNPTIEARIQKKWIEGIERSGLSTEEKNKAYQRMKIDKPATVENNILWLEEAGFTEVELLYKYGPFGVISGLRASN